jgi:Flp pilus assembly pilin Flp
MKKLALRLWRDEAGFVVSTELVLVATIVVIGLVTGLTTIRDQLSTELADVADAISEVDQSYSFGQITAHASSTSGTIFDDVEDFCEAAGNVTDQNGEAGTQCLSINVSASANE